MKSLKFLLVFMSLGVQAQHSYNLVREDVMIPMRDGVKLGAILYRPDKAGKFPGIVYRTPYGVDDYDAYAEFPLKAAKQGYALSIAVPQIVKQANCERVVLLGHSMGGLAAREYLQNPNYSYNAQSSVSKIVTIGVLFTIFEFGKILI